MALLEVRDLVVRFRTADGTIHAVNGVSFELEAGERLGLVGESGCGKSVTNLAIIRLLPRPAGRIEGGAVVFAGQDLLALREEEVREIRGRDIAMIFQDPMTSLNPVLTIEEQLVETIVAHRPVGRDEARQRAIELLRMVGIPKPESRLRSYPHQFSGGMRQRVMIAMALALEPQILIADEPTTALDVTIQAQVLELLRRLTEEHGTALILITHDLGVVAGMTDRVAVMYAGFIVETASTSELFARPAHPYTVGLLHSIPRVDERDGEELIPIEGRPPDMRELPPGCPFAPRCAWRLSVCWEVNPELGPVPRPMEAEAGAGAGLGVGEGPAGLAAAGAGQSPAAAEAGAGPEARARRVPHLTACHNPPTVEEARVGRPLRAGFRPAPAPDGRLDELGAVEAAGETTEASGEVARRREDAEPAGETGPR